MCKSKSKMFLVSLALLVLALSQVSAWPSLKKEEAQIQIIPQAQVQVQEPLQMPPQEELPQEEPKTEAPLLSQANGLTEQDKILLRDLLEELKTSVEESTKETIRIKTGELELLLAELDKMQASKAVMDASHMELEESYKAKDEEYNALADAFAKAQRGKLMLGTGASFDISSLTVGAGIETGFMGQNYYTTLGVDKGIYSVKNGFLNWGDGYELSLKFGLLF